MLEMLSARLEAGPQLTFSICDLAAWLKKTKQEGRVRTRLVQHLHREESGRLLINQVKIKCHWE